MAKFVKTVEVNAYQFKFEGTEMQRDVFEGNSSQAEMGYEGALEDVIFANIQDVRISLESIPYSHKSLGVMVVDLGWIDSSGEDYNRETFTLRDGDWLVEDRSSNPVYQVLTNDEFSAFSAITL